uniref:Ribonuclease H-like domain-containing protein n=1 Tax=Tanacetum cinerariifolium TaxID=118510 RepID=A0A6L2NS72_TANCI|nr:ribonuclease H-like domain-containing protein [Tanacetum cinerariifolium]
MGKCDIVTTPMATAKINADLQGNPTDQTKYRSMIGGLMYLTASQPNIAFSTFVCARYQAPPTKKHLKEVKRIFQYLRQSINKGLEWKFLQSNTSNNNNADGTSTSIIPGLVTTEEKAQKKNDVKDRSITNEVDTANIQVSTVSTPVSTVSTHDNTANLSDATVGNGFEVAVSFAEHESKKNVPIVIRWDIFQGNAEVLRIKKVLIKATWKMMKFQSTWLLWLSQTQRQGVGFASYNAVVPPHTCLFAPPTIDLSNSRLKEFQHPKFKGYGPKASKSVCVDTSKEIKKAPDAPINED